MKSWLIRHYQGAMVAITVGITCLGGIYINLLTTNLSSAATATPKAAVVSLGAWNLLAIGTIILGILQAYIGSLPTAAIAARKGELVTLILAAAAKSLIYPHTTRHIRGIVSVYDPDRKVRRVRYHYNTRADPERTAEFPVKFGVTGKAFLHKAVFVEELPLDHVKEERREGVADFVLSDLRTVIAAPILGISERDTPLGVLAFDSILPLSKLSFGRREIKAIVQEWADIIGILLRD